MGKRRKYSSEFKREREVLAQREEQIWEEIETFFRADSR